MWGENFDWKTERRSDSFGRTWRSLKDNIKVELSKICCENREMWRHNVLSLVHNL